ncbi:carotenoid oxygenase family protein [Nocardioides acrostichi]|uniref:Dioxygenase n=1 Tax=Nocardioides acrostichi TaxID=2784339 RepID=A0A930UTL6_9ACTN|nr:carotenoid oxygenase family protein [Nocardioides acrostichi]MBF4160603.1 carotenoid oxygenase family protein [Nocardioides acrostichi]
MSTAPTTPGRIAPGALSDERYATIDEQLDAPTYNRTSPYDVPGYRPVRWELGHTEVEVSGALPADLEGVYLRNGTNVQFDAERVRLHAFNGAGMIHQIQILDGTATYANAYVRTPRFEAEQEAGREIYVEFSDLSTAGPLALSKIGLVEEQARRGLIPLVDPFERTPGSTSIRYHHGRLYCLQETGYAFVLDARFEDGRLVLDGTGRLETWDGEWEGPFSAHPRIEPGSGDVYNLSVTPEGRIVAGQLSEGELVRQAPVHQQGSAGEGQMGWLHDFFLTENYLVFPDISLRRDPQGLQRTDGSVFVFDEAAPLRWGVLPRAFDAETQVRWFTTDQAATVWHVINAWERPSASGGAEIVLFSPSFSTYPSTVPIHTPEEPPAQVRTWTLDLDTGEVSDQRLLLDHGYERPSLNLDYVGRPSRYSYLLDEHGDGYMGVGVAKFDMVEEEVVGYLDYGGMYGGEALFVPRPEAQAEDDGYLLDLLMSEDRADLIVIDAATMTELARLHLPRRVPFGVHACWLTPDELGAVERFTPAP